MWSLLAGAVGVALRVLLSGAEWVYVLGRRPGSDWTRTRPPGRSYRTTWQVGRVVFWAPVVAAGLVLVYLVYFWRGGL